MSERPEPLIDRAMSALDGVTHGFFTRRGGVSAGTYASLNCGFGSRDDPAAVRENRERAVASLGHARREIATAYQIHSRRVVEVDAPWQPGSGPEADGMVSTRRGVAIGIMTADCVPVLLADAEAGVVGAAHAGWRGALSGIVEETVAAMVARGARPERIHAAVGPCIGPASYEVGMDLRRAFLDQDDANGRFFGSAERSGHYLFDLGGYVRQRLDRIGVGYISSIPRDTCAEAESFFSYRRTCREGGDDYGRNLSMIMLED
jgi:YfiH family protein